MATQRYLCREHGEFTVTQSIYDPVLPVRACPQDSCGLAGDWLPSAPAAVHVDGGTGAGRLMGQRRLDAREQFREEHSLER